MPDRLIRDELLESERWLWLPSDTDRIVFVALILRSDDFGNLEAGVRRMFRFMQSFAQVRTEENAATVMSHLSDADLIRSYAVDGRDFIHIPRLRSPSYYPVRKCPPSPWDEKKVLGKQVRSIRNQGLAKNLLVTSLERNKDVHQGEGEVDGEGEGKGEGENRKRSKALGSRATRLPPDWQLPQDWKDWAVKIHHLEPDRVVRISLAFRDYWIAKPKDATKVDWLATWRNWIRKETQDA